MFAEDEYLKALIDRDNKISYFQEQLEKTSMQLVNEKKLNQEKDEALDSEKAKNRQLMIVLAKA